MKNKRELIIVSFVILLCVSLTYSIFSKNKNDITSFPDQPKIEDNHYHVITASSWGLPKQPEIIKESIDKRLDNFFANQIWVEKPPEFLQQEFNKLHINQKYYDYFYGNGLYPLMYDKADLNGDGKPDDYFQSIGTGCGSCHANYIAIFVNNKIYTTDTNDGFMKPRDDRKGFYLADTIYGTDYSIRMGFTIKRFLWNGNGFNEVGEKKVYTTVKK